MTELSALCRKKDCYYFLSPYGFGDTIMLCAFREAWERKNKGKIHFIIKPSHEIIMQMYGITDYTLYSFRTEWFKSEFMALDTGAQKPEKGKIWVAHPHYHAYCQPLLEKYDAPSSIEPFEDFYKAFLALPMSTSMSMPTHKIDALSTLQQKVKDIRNVVLILPEANTLPLLDKRFWKKLCRQKLKGKHVIQNVCRPENKIDGITFVDLTLAELVTLSGLCADIYAYRSGLCDLLACSARHMHIFYPKTYQNTSIRYSVNRMFHRRFVEEVVSTETVTTKNFFLFKKVTKKNGCQTQKRYYFLFLPVMQKIKNDKMHRISFLGGLLSISINRG